MTVRRLAPVDAQTYWMSGALPNDQFLLYAFAGAPADLGRAVAQVRERAQACADLRMRIEGDSRWRYPSWAPADVETGQFVVHEPGGDGGDTWAGCLAALAELADHQLDPRRAAWRVHVFPVVRGVPDTSGCAAVVVLQLVHALADGTRSAEIAAWLFGRAVPVPAVQGMPAVPPGALLWRSAVAARAHRQLVHDVDAGRVPPPGRSRLALLTNSRPDGPRAVRTLIRARSALTGPTVTVAALIAISAALSDYLVDHGDDASDFAAEIPMAASGIRQAHNHFRNVGVGLYPDLPIAQRGQRIAAELAAHRARGGHPAMIAERRAFAAVPAPLLRWGVAQFDLDVRSPLVTGNTVVSSVYRGPADLAFGDQPVVFTAGYPALSPMIGLTHGVHGIGETVAISVHTARSVVDIDDYVARLDRALG